MKNSDKPAIQAFGANGVPLDENDEHGIKEMLTGFTKREAFTMAAMQGILSHGYAGLHSFGFDQDEYKLLANAAVKQADALLKELE